MTNIKDGNDRPLIPRLQKIQLRNCEENHCQVVGDCMACLSVVVGTRELIATYISMSIFVSRDRLTGWDFN